MPDEISRRVDSVSFTWSTPSDDVKSAKWSLRLKDFQRDVLAVPEGKMKKTVSTFENVNATTAEQEHFGFCFDGDDSNGSAYVYDWILNYRAN